VFINRKTLTSLTAAVLLAGALAGCSAFGAGKDDDGAKPAAGSAASPGAVQEPAGAAGGPVEEAGAASGPVIKSFSFTKGERPIQLDIVSLRASGQLLRLDMRVTNKDDDPSVTGWQLANLFDSYGPIKAIILEDTKNLVQYPTAEAGNYCACTRDEGGIFIKAGDSRDLYALFKMPPAGVSSIDVVLPNGLPRIAAAPITR